MLIVDRYLLRAIVGATMMVLLVLLGLGGFFEFFGELNDIGIGSYGVGEAVVFVLLLMPQMAFEMMPAAALLGALLGLGGLASNSELMVMRAAGVSHMRLVRSAAVAGLMIALLTAALGESIAPPLGQFARQFRTLSKHDDLSLADGRSAWVKDGDTIFNVQQMTQDFRFGGVFVFAFDEEHRLKRVGRADSAGLDSNNRWFLDNYAESSFSDQGVTARVAKRAEQDYNISADLLGWSVVRPDALTVLGLSRVVENLGSNGLDTRRYEVAFWSRIASTLSITVMTVLALPFVFGSLRSAGAGARILVGLLIGLGYYLASQTLTNSGQVFNLDPAMVAWLPTLVLMGITTLGLSRVR